MFQCACFMMEWRQIKHCIVSILVFEIQQQILIFLIYMTRFTISLVWRAAFISSDYMVDDYCARAFRPTSS